MAALLARCLVVAGLATNAAGAAAWRRAPRVAWRASPVLTSTYSAEDITVLEGLEPVRKRPGMYIGSTGPAGLHHLVFEVVDNSVDEALAGHCTTILVSLMRDGSAVVVDDGRGIPCDTHAKTGRSALETVLTVLHAGGKFGDAGYAVSGGLHGVGVSVVNALSQRLDVRVRRNGREHAMAFERGSVTQPISSVPIDLPPVPEGKDRGVDPWEWTTTGTRVQFWPDPDIFHAGTAFDFETLARRLDQLTYLNAGLVVHLSDWRGRAEGAEPACTRFVHTGGISEMVSDICAGATFGSPGGPPAEGKKHACLAPEPIPACGERKGVRVDLALQWTLDSYNERVLSFANGIHTPAGGTHSEGLKAAVTRAVNGALRRTAAAANAAGQQRARTKVPKEAGSLPGEFIREGLTAVVSVHLANPEFEGQTKGRLGSVEARGAVDSVLSDALTAHFDFHPKQLAALAAKALAAQRAAEAARAARDLLRAKSSLPRTVLPGKLADCSAGRADGAELFIVEGDSAGGSAKQGRDRRSQAILPLRGKILNIEKARVALGRGLRAPASRRLPPAPLRVPPLRTRWTTAACTRIRRSSRSSRA